MFRTKDKINLISIERIWFAETDEMSDAKIIRYVHSMQPKSGKYIVCTPSETVINDIQGSTASLLSGCTKTIKYEVNKCSKESVNINFFTAKDIINNSLLDEFEVAYKEFAKGLEDKTVLSSYNRHKIENLVETDHILISKAEKDSIVIYHVYAWGNDSACLLYSVSNFRNDFSLRSLAGRMNKLLHIKDIEWFRDCGVRRYDWGNINSSSNPNGIDKFKMSFGGEVVTVYNILIGNSLIGNFIAWVLNKRKN